MLPKPSRQMILSYGFIGTFVAFAIGLLFPPETPALVHLIFLGLGGCLFAIGYWVWMDARNANISILVVSDEADHVDLSEFTTSAPTRHRDIRGLYSDDEVRVQTALALAKDLLRHPNIGLVVLPHTDTTCVNAKLFAVNLATAWRYYQVFGQFQAWSNPIISLQHRRNSASEVSPQEGLTQ